MQLISPFPIWLNSRNLWSSGMYAAGAARSLVALCGGEQVDEAISVRRIERKLPEVSQSTAAMEEPSNDDHPDFGIAPGNPRD